ncbi:hypothetical protein [Streptomyces sp. NPDC048516]|uniref:hypothetical protein n=1 Tax=Streptomyces sp. NPDC048516 TaxID=3365565 RepID=UPI003712FA16
MARQVCSRCWWCALLVRAVWVSGVGGGVVSAEVGGRDVDPDGGPDGGLDGRVGLG